MRQITFEITRDDRRSGNGYWLQWPDCGIWISEANYNSLKAVLLADPVGEQPYWTYTKETQTGAEYIALSNQIGRGKVSNTKLLRENLLIDLDEQGKIIGVEILDLPGANPVAEGECCTKCVDGSPAMTVKWCGYKGDCPCHTRKEVIRDYVEDAPVRPPIEPIEDGTDIVSFARGWIENMPFDDKNIELYVKGNIMTFARALNRLQKK